MRTRVAAAASICSARCLVSETRPPGNLDRMSPQHSRWIVREGIGLATRLQVGLKLVYTQAAAAYVSQDSLLKR